MSLVRLTLNRETLDLLVESGEVFYRDLISVEQKELKTLEEQLANFQDFTTAEKLQDEQRKAVMEKKRRYTLLQQLPTTPQIEWKIVESPPKSILLLTRPGFITEYAENIPGFLLEKMTSREIIINIAAPVPAGAPISEPRPQNQPSPPPEPSLVKNRVEAKLFEIQDKLSKPWNELVAIEIKDNVYHISAKIWLQTDFGPIDDAIIKGLSGKWISKGKGDKNAHWEVQR